MFEGFLVGRKKVEVSILQYADNIVFFGEATMTNVAAIKTMLWSFEMVSGQKINFAKSCFGAFGMSDEWVNNAVDFLSCRLLSVPFTYLGIPIGANPWRSETWETIIAKCEKRLSNWRQRHLSFGGSDSN